MRGSRHNLDNVLRGLETRFNALVAKDRLDPDSKDGRQIAQGIKDLIPKVRGARNFLKPLEVIEALGTEMGTLFEILETHERK